MATDVQTEPVKTQAAPVWLGFCFCYPLSVLMTLAISIWLPIQSERAYILLSMDAVLGMFLIATIVCIPSAVVFFALLWIRPLRRLPLPLLSLLPTAMNFVPWYAFLEMMRQLD